MLGGVSVKEKETGYFLWDARDRGRLLATVHKWCSGITGRNQGFKRMKIESKQIDGDRQ